MKIYLLLIILLLGTNANTKAQQKVVAECTVTYTISIDSAVDKDLLETLKSTSKTVYIKGNNSRSDLISSAFTQSLLYDKKTSSATILREFGNNKFMTQLNNAQWLSENNKFEGMTFTPLNENKSILGYACKKASLQLKDANSYTLYYATSIVPSVQEFEYQFKDVPGFVLEYEAQENGRKLKYTATKISFNPVLSTRFNIPTTGYRLLN